MWVCFPCQPSYTYSKSFSKAVAFREQTDVARSCSTQRKGVRNKLYVGYLSVFWIRFTLCSLHALRKEHVNPNPTNNTRRNSTTINSKPITLAPKCSTDLEASTKRYCAEQHIALSFFPLGPGAPWGVKFSAVSVQGQSSTHSFLH